MRSRAKIFVTRKTLCSLWFSNYIIIKDKCFVFILFAFTNFEIYLTNWYTTLPLIYKSFFLINELSFHTDLPELLLLLVNVLTDYYRYFYLFI